MFLKYSGLAPAGPALAPRYSTACLTPGFTSESSAAAATATSTASWTAWTGRNWAAPR